jgi:dTDP-4-dehydrorhamnose 3,5-epimerase
MRVLTTELSGVLIIEPKVFSDSRGYFFESFQAERYRQHNIPDKFVQDNISHSVKNVVRGLHYQLAKPQGKLVFVTYGKVKDVIVDIRVSSPTFGKHVCVELSDENYRQVYIPPGFAHGFSVLSDVAGFMYKCTDYYDPSSERGILWNDPDLQIAWSVDNPILSGKDNEYPCLKNISKDQLFS